MFEFRRNQIIVTVLVFMIAIAAFLQFKDPGEIVVAPQLVEGEGAMKEVAVTEIDPSDVDFFEQFTVDENGAIETLAPDAQDEEEAVPSEEAESNVKTGDVVITKQNPNNLVESKGDKNISVSYFVEEKMLREQTRAAQIEQLTEYVANESLDADTKAKAAESLLALNDRIEKENAAEALLRAKGFKDVFVRIDEKSVDVVINRTDLSDEEIAQIEEIVHRKTGYSIGQIKIHMNKENANN
ncbi:MAG: SpoIIIAH-like family protein [Cellulosilyticaceae bacterium]